MNRSRMNGIRWISTMCICLICLFNPSLAYADTLHNIISQHGVVVHRQDVVEDVVVIGHNAKVSGDVYEALIVLDGNVHLTSTARVGILIDFGGEIQKDVGAKVNAEYAFSSGKPFWDSVFLGSSMVLVIWILRVVFNLFLLLDAIFLGLILGQKLQLVVEYVTQSARRSGIVGLLSGLGSAIVAGILGVTLVGIPISILILGALTILGLIGWAAVSLWLGRLFSQAFLLRELSIWIQCTIGAGVLIACMNVPIVGLLLFLMFWFVGIGAVVLWISRFVSDWKKKKSTMS